VTADTLWDVAVVGGGSAGFAAAVCAAEAGARTLLIERASQLGGNISQALVHTICGAYLQDEEKPRPSNPGFPQRFVDGLLRSGGASSPERVGRVWVLPTMPPAVAAEAGRWCDDRSGLTCWTTANVEGASLAREAGSLNRLTVARAQRESMPEEIEARVVIDASGEGVLGRLAGADFQLSPGDALQASSFIFGLTGIPAEALSGFARMQLSVAIGRASHTGALPPECESILLRPAAARGQENGQEHCDAYATLNMHPLPGRPHDPLDKGYCDAMSELARRHAREIVEHLRRERDGFSDCRVSVWPRRLGVREGRRLLGDVVLGKDDLLSGRERPDEIARSCWPIELWDDPRRARMHYPNGPASVPLGSLSSRSHPTLGMAGRCLSASHEALGALRVIGTSLATGAAVGRAASIAAERRCGLSQVEPQAVRSAALGDEA
jgi:hypothetical protein